MEAISVLQDAPFEKVASLVYKNAPIFMENEPEATVEMLLSKHRVPPGEVGLFYMSFLGYFTRAHTYSHTFSYSYYSYTKLDILVLVMLPSHSHSHLTLTLTQTHPLTLTHINTTYTYTQTQVHDNKLYITSLVKLPYLLCTYRRACAI